MMPEIIPFGDFMPIRIGYKYTSPVHSSYASYHSHPQYEIYYFHGGACTFIIGDQLHVLAPGDLIILDGLTLHCPKINPNFEYTRSTIHFDGSYVADLLRLPAPLDLLSPFTRLRHHVISLSGEERVEAETLLYRMHLTSGVKDPLTYNRFCLHFTELLLFIYERCEKTIMAPRKPLSDKEKNVQNIISYIEAHLEQDLHLDELERKLHLDKHYLSHIFKEVTGMTIFTHLYTQRINRARLLFTIGEHDSVTDVCFRVGFKHLPHFSRMFKKMIGMTPDAFRKTVQQARKHS